MKCDLKETAVFLIPKEHLAFMKDDSGFVEHIVNHLSSELAERIMGILEREEEIIVRQSDLRVSEFMPTNSVEYRRQITWSSLVRCKDCKHRDGEDGQCPLQTTGDPYLDTYPQNNFYCADGERREDYAEVH